MTHCMLLPLLLALGCMYVCAAPVAHEDIQPGLCEDASAKGAAELALNKINGDRQEGYIFALHRLSNVHMAKHGESGMVFYLTLDVVETNCSVLSKKDWKACEARPTHDTRVYGQCKAAIYISKVRRVTRLHKYDCVVRPVPRDSVGCGGCLSLIDIQGADVHKAVALSLEKFNNGSVLHFTLLKVQRAHSQVVAGKSYRVEYTIQETNCTKGAAAADECPHKEREFAHKGFCQASIYYPLRGDGEANVECEIYEPEAAEAEKKHPLLGGETDHDHKDTHAHSHNHDGVHGADGAHTHDHDHDHDHAKSHTHRNTTRKHSGDRRQHHTRDHEVGSGHRHAHNHSHDHGHGHGHDHGHDHGHGHGHDHGHDHNHGHDHEHHHHQQAATAHDHPVGTVRYLPAMNQPMTLPSFPDVPAGGPEVGVTLPLRPDPRVPGRMEPIIQPFPGAISPSCAPGVTGDSGLEKLFAEDPMFKPAA